jgi:hypothetical protein
MGILGVCNKELSDMLAINRNGWITDYIKPIEERFNGVCKKKV